MGYDTESKLCNSSCIDNVESNLLSCSFVLDFDIAVQAPSSQQIFVFSKHSIRLHDSSCLAEGFQVIHKPPKKTFDDLWIVETVAEDDLNAELLVKSPCMNEAVSGKGTRGRGW